MMVMKVMLCIGTNRVSKCDDDGRNKDGNDGHAHADVRGDDGGYSS